MSFGYYNNAYSENNKTSISYDSPRGQPTAYCNRQWKYLSSTCSGLPELVKRILIFVPLVIVSSVVYPISFINSTQIATITGSGTLATSRKDFTSSQINEVELRGTGNLVIKKGNENSLITSADHNILEHFDSHVEGTKLILGMKPGSFRFVRSPSYTLTIPSNLRDLSITGSGNVTIDELTTDTFSCNISGLGKLNILKGIVNDQKITISGSGEYVAPNLLGITSHININGLGKATIQVRDALKVNISGSGKCVYSGHPPLITQHISGFGNIHHRD
jgi:hypothetical protein